MERITTNKEIKEMTILELACNCVYPKDGWIRYRDYDTDMDLIEFIVDLNNKLGGELETEELGTVEKEDIDEELWDNLQYPLTSIDGLLAFTYRNLVAICRLRGRLKQYEDLGLTPQQLLQMNDAYSEQAKELFKLRKKNRILKADLEATEKLYKLEQMFPGE